MGFFLFERNLKSFQRIADIDNYILFYGTNQVLITENVNYDKKLCNSSNYAFLQNYRHLPSYRYQDDNTDFMLFNTLTL